MLRQEELGARIDSERKNEWSHQNQERKQQAAKLVESPHCQSSQRLTQEKCGLVANQEEIKIQVLTFKVI